QPFDAIFERLGRFCIFFPGRFKEWPEKRKREKSPVESSYWRFHLDLVFALARSNVTDRQTNGDAKTQRSKNSRHGIFAQKMFGALQGFVRLLLGFVPRLAHFRGNFFCCSTKLLTPS